MIRQVVVSKGCEKDVKMYCEVFQIIIYIYSHSQYNYHPF